MSKKLLKRKMFSEVIKKKKFVKINKINNNIDKIKYLFYFSFVFCQIINKTNK